jgi:succinate dehydrogenase/fumarate reductase flavoprotein subunit
MLKMGDWPYQVDYSCEVFVQTDVLVIGGGIAGSHAAINASKKGVSVCVVDKAAILRSGAAGAGIDHWHHCCTNPASKVTPDEMEEAVDRSTPWAFGHIGYIGCKETFEALLDLEKWGLPFRDVDDEFKDAPFRDEESKILFAYDYANKYCIRLRGGHQLKPVLYKELKRRNIPLYEHIMMTSLLTKGGRAGEKIIGATGVNVRTGEFYIFQAKATVLSTCALSGLWAFSTDLAGSATVHADPNNTGDGYAMAWRAGAEFTLMESKHAGVGFQYVDFGTGNPHNTWFPCSIVDANGKEVPWVDRDGRTLKTVDERHVPAPGQKFFIHSGPQPYETLSPRTIKDLPERIRKGEFQLPLYADLPGMPEQERRAIFGLMIGNEGKTRIVYQKYTEGGFDPDKDMLQAPIMPPEYYVFEAWWRSYPLKQWQNGGGHIVTDWDLKTTLDGLFAAGGMAGSVNYNGAGGASATGRYAGRKAAIYAEKNQHYELNRGQIEEEKRRIYAPIARETGTSWKDLRTGVARIMQDHCGEFISETVLNTGLDWLKGLGESEAKNLYARNPHELWRALESLNRITEGQMVMHASLARKASNSKLHFYRLDHPERDVVEWNKYITIRQKGGSVAVGELPLRYWLLPPNAPTYIENYNAHCALPEI